MEHKSKLPRLPHLKLIKRGGQVDQFRHLIRTKHYSLRTENSYVNWVKKFIIFHNKQHPSTLNDSAVNKFLTHLVVIENVASATQNQPLSALKLFNKELLKKPPIFLETNVE